MPLLSNFLYLSAFWISSYTGFNELGLQFIVIAGFFFMLGWMAIRVDYCKRFIQHYGALAIFRLILSQISIYSILSGIIYFIAYFIASLI